MKSFKQFLRDVQEMVANCTGPGISGTDMSDTTAPAQPLLFKGLIRRKKNTGGTVRRNGETSKA